MTIRTNKNRPEKKVHRSINNNASKLDAFIFYRHQQNSL